MAFCIYLGLSNPSIEAAINTGLTTSLDKITNTGRPCPMNAHLIRMAGAYRCTEPKGTSG